MTRIAASAAQRRHPWCSRRWSATPEGAQPADTRRGGEVRQPTCRRWLLCFIPIHTVTAQRSERTEHDVQWLSSERFTGGYMRRLSLGQDIDVDHIAATYQNGVLTVTLPVAARAEPRHIEITPGAREETKVIEPTDPSDQHTTTQPLFTRRGPGGHAAGP